MSAEPYFVKSASAPLADAERQRQERGLWLWTLADCLILLVLLFVLTIPLVMYFLAADGAFVGGSGSGNFLEVAQSTANSIQTNPARFFAAALLQNVVMVGVPVLRVRALRRLPWEWLGITAQHFARNIGLGLAVGAVGFVLNFALSQLFEWLGQTPDQAALFPVHAHDPAGQALVLIAGAVLAPIVEELFFRGYIFKAWMQRWGAPVAYIASALIFTVPHLAGITTGYIGLIVPIFGLGLLLAWAYHRSRSLVPGIVAHMLNNSVGLGLLIYCVNRGNTNCT